MTPRTRRRIDMVGYVSNEQLVQEMKNCSLLALFSWEETRPTVVAQAMAAGKPIVASRVGGLAEMVISEHNGYLVAPGDEDGLAGCMAAILANPSMRRDMGRASSVIASEQFRQNRLPSKLFSATRLFCEGGAASPCNAASPVTGGAGFIGSHLVEALVRQGVRNITVLDNLSEGILAICAQCSTGSRC